MSNWINRATVNLLERSEEKENFHIARLEWLYKGLEDNQDCQASCELCNHEDIRYEYTIINKLNDNEMIVGSECIKKFTDDFKHDFFDTQGNLVDESRLSKDKKEYFQKILDRLLDERIFILSNPFLLSIGKQIKKDGKLTPNQLKYLKSFYNSLDDIEQRAFKAIVKVNLRKNKAKEQMSNLSQADFNFVNKFLTANQRDTYRI